MTPIRHKACGAITAWYRHNAPRSPDIAYAEDYVRLDGTSPTCNTLINEVCAGCGGAILAPDELERCFDEVTG